MINVAFIKSKMLTIPWKILGQGEIICVLNLFGVCKGKHIEPSWLNTCFMVVRINYSNNFSWRRKIPIIKLNQDADKKVKMKWSGRV